MTITQLIDAWDAHDSNWRANHYAVAAFERGQLPPKSGGKKASAPRRSAPRKPRQARRMKDPDGPPTYRQARAIGHALGGIKTYCPSLAGQVDPQTGRHVSNQQILIQMGVNKRNASACMDALEKANVLGYNFGNASAIAKATRIFEQTTGASCPWHA
jgi:hypothetical protein